MTDQADIEQRVADELARNMRIHHLKQSQWQVQEARLMLQNVKYLIPTEADAIRRLDAAIRSLQQIEYAVERLHIEGSK